MSEGEPGSIERMQEALGWIAEAFGQGNCEGFMADVAVWALGWCGKCGMPNELVPAHGVMVEMTPYGHPFEPMTEKPYMDNA